MTDPDWKQDQAETSRLPPKRCSSGTHELLMLADRMENHVVSRLPAHEPVVKNGAWQMMLDAARAIRHLVDVAQARPMPPEPYWLPFKVVGGCIRDAKDNYVAELSSPFGGDIRDQMAQFLVAAANASSVPSTEGK